MSNFFFPMHIDELSSDADIISIESQPESHILSLLSTSTIFLRDATRYAHPLIFQYRRTTESLQKYGQNHWARWISNDTVSFGTKTGSIFISKISNDGIIQEPHICHLSKVVVSTFVAFQHLALCTADSQIFYVNDCAEVFYTMKLDSCEGPLQNVQFKNNILSCMIGNQANFFTLDENTFKNQYQPMRKTIPVQKLSMIAMNHSFYFLAIVTSDGRVILLNTGTRKVKPHEVCKADASNPIISIFWVFYETVLIILQNDGRLTALNLITMQKISTSIPQLTGSIATCYDPFSLRIYFSDLKKIDFLICNIMNGCVSFSTCDFFDYLTMKKRIELIDYYPIRYCQKCPNSMYFIQSVDKVCVIENGQTRSSKTFEENIIDSRLVGNHIFVFLNQKLFIHDFDLKLVKFVEFHSRLLYLSHNKDKLIMTINKAFVTIDQNLEMMKQSLEHPIKAAMFAGRDEYLLLTNDYKATLFPNNLDLLTNAKFLWGIEEPPYIFIHKDNYVVITLYGKRVKYERTPIYADEANFYIVSPELNFGEYSFEQRRYASYFIATMPEYREYLTDKIKNRDDYVNIIADAFGLSLLYYPNAEGFHEFLLALPPDQLSEVLTIRFQKIDDEDKDILFNKMNKDFAESFEFLNDQAKNGLLMILPVNKFVNFIDRFKFDPVSFIQKSLHKRDITRAFRASVAASTNICDELQNIRSIITMSLEHAIEMMSVDLRMWAQMKDQVSIYKFLGSVLISSGYYILALAIFILLKDEMKIESLLTLDEQLKTSIQGVVDLRPDKEYCIFLKQFL